MPLEADVKRVSKPFGCCDDAQSGLRTEDPQPRFTPLSSQHEKACLSPPGGDVLESQRWCKGESRRRQSSQRMLPPVAAPHCGICSRPFRLLTWRHKPVPGAGSLCFSRRFRGAKRPSSESLGRGGWGSDPAWLRHLFVGHNLRGKSLLSTVARSELFPGEKCGPESSRCVFRWICARLRNESSGEDPAAPAAALLLWSRAAGCHVDQSDPPGTRWDAYLQTTLITSALPVTVCACRFKLKL